MVAGGSRHDPDERGARGGHRGRPSAREHSRRDLHRQHPREGPSLCSRREKGGETAQAIGRSRGGRTGKVHALANAQGKPIAFVLTPGNIADISVAAQLLDGIAPPRRLLADKAYDSNALRHIVAGMGAEAVIPCNPTRKRPIPYDCEAYKVRNLIERCFNKLKHFRRIATRYDRRADHFLGFIHLACAILWMR